MMVVLWVWMSCEMVGCDGIGREKSKSEVDVEGGISEI